MKKKYALQLLLTCLIICHCFSFFGYAQDPNLDEWRMKNEPENYTPRHECSVVQAGDKFYVMGGRENATTIDVYDYTANTWTQIPDSPPVEFNHFQATEYKGLIWVIGAFKTNLYPNEAPADYIWAFDPVKEEWIQGPEIPDNRKRGSAGLVVYNDKFYISGGNTIGHNGGYVSWFDEYDPATGTWTPLTDTPRSRDHFHAAVIDNKMYLAGGRLSGGEGGVFRPTIAEVDVYDFTTDTWSTLPGGQNLPTPRGAPAVASFNDKLVVIGGEVENQQVYGETVNDALKITEQYDPVAQQWTRLPDLNSERHGTQAIVSGNGIFILAGSPNKGGGNQRNMEYLGEDNPVGTANTPSTLVTPDVVDLEPGGSLDFDIEVTGGNMGVFIRSMVVTGGGAANFNIASGALENAFLNPESSHAITVNLNSSGQNTSAVLTIEYGASSQQEIILKNGVPSSGINNPGTQYNKEGDVVNLPIQATDNNGGYSFSATGLPPSLSIDASTGLISGTVSSGNATGAFVEESGLVVIEAESGDIVPGWTQTTADGATGIVAGRDSFNSINGGTIPYQVTVNTPGVYRFNWRSFYSGNSGTDENDNWLRFPNNDDVWFFGYKGNPGNEAATIANLQGAQENIVFPRGSSRITPETTPEGGGAQGFFKIYRSSGTSQIYDWQARTSDNDSHNIYVWFAAAGTYTMEISERSKGHAIDKMALYRLDGPSYSDAELTAAVESNRGSGDAGGGAAANSPYQVEVTATDNADPSNSSVAEFIWVIDNSGNPMARAEAAPMTGQVPLVVSFTGSRSVDDIGIAQYRWEFGDALASTSNLADPSFTFTEPGTFNTILTVTDADGKIDSESLEIVVDPKPVYTINAMTGENGTISPNGEIEVIEGADQVFLITANEGYAISEVSVDGVSQGPIDTFTFGEVDSPHTITASFRLAEYTITASAGQGGTIDPEGINSVFEGSSLGFSVVANTDFAFDYFLVDGAIIPDISDYVFENVTASHTIEAIFKPVPVTENPEFTIATSATAGGQLSPNGNVVVLEGSDQTFAIVADTGFEIADIKVDGTSIPISEDYTFDNIVKNHTLEVFFVETIDGEDGGEAPTAVAVSDVSQGSAPLRVNFDGSGSTDDADITTYMWDFGDGTPEESGSTVSHTYSTEGSYTAMLKVTDTAGQTSTVSVVITVIGPSDVENDLRLFPNAASEKVSLGFINPVDLKSIYIYDMGGKLMRALDATQIQFEGNYVIDVSMLSEGLYFIGSEDGNGNEFHKLMLIKR